MDPETGSLKQVKWFNGDYEEDSTSAGLKKYHYISGGNGLTAIFVKQGSGNDTMYHVFSDHLGSLTTIVNASTNSVENYSFNAWGTPRDPDNWDQPFTGSLFAGRGYTGHEHLTDFNLINMNGRVYDPVLGRFLSPDPYVQLAEYPNSFNRYSYALNNPLIYVDPYGEAWWHWALAAMGLGIIPPGTAESYAATFGAKTANSATIGFFDGLPDGFSKGFDEASRRANNSWDISMGLFQVDETQGNDFNQFLQVVSRFTWQQPMTLIGYEYANFVNNTGKIDIKQFHGATVVVDPGMGSAVSMGGYITINPRYGDIDYDNPTLLHEYGHFLQTRQWGGLAFIPGALLSIGSASDLDLRSTETHQGIWIEQDANKRSREYFDSFLTPAQKFKFNSKFSYQKYYDNRFLRNWLLPDWLLLYLYDVIWSD
ncbi:MAG: RHS repeat-associated core domain-containing protein [Bacteroidota bacterium]